MLTEKQKHALMTEIGKRVPPIPLTEFHFCPFCGDALRLQFCCDLWKEVCEKIGAIQYVIARD